MMVCNVVMFHGSRRDVVANAEVTYEEVRPDSGVVVQEVQEQGTAWALDTQVGQGQGQERSQGFQGAEGGW